MPELSGVYGDVTRADYVKVRALNRQGKPFILEARGFLARAVQRRNGPLRRCAVYI